MSAPKILKVVLALAIALGTVAPAGAQPYVYRIPLQGVDALPALPDGGTDNGTLASAPYGSFSFVLNDAVSIPAPAVTGGSGGYQFALRSGALPPGTALNTDGSISGSATANGNFAASIGITDSNGAQSASTVVVNVAAGVSASIAGLPATAAAGTAVAASAQASGGTAPYAYAIASGALPNGVSLLSDGSLSGTLSAPGSFSFSIRATDSAGRTTTASASITVTSAPVLNLAVNPALPTEALVGTPIANLTAAATGGVAPFALSLERTVPPGLSLSGNVVGGTPTTPGTYDWAVKATDSASSPTSIESSATTTVYAQLTAGLSGNPQTDAVAGTAIDPVTLTAQGGKPPYSYGTTGTLPPGLSFNGTLQGVPTTAGSYSFALTVSDSYSPVNAMTSATYSMTVETAPLQLAQGPAVPSTVGIGQALGGGFTATGGKSPYTYAVSSGSLPPGINLSPSGSFTGSATIAGSGQAFSFTVTATDSSPTPKTASSQANVTVTDQAPLSLAYSASTYEGSAGVGGNVPVPTLTGGSGGVTYASSSQAQLSVNPATGAASYNFASAGTYGPFTITATDSVGRTATSTVTIEVKSPPVVSTASLPAATQGQNGYAFATSASGGSTPYAWTLRVNGTPIANNGLIGTTGLRWFTTGLISGNVAANAASVANVTLQATDSFGRASAQTASMTLQVFASPTAPAYPASIISDTGVQRDTAPTTAAANGTAPYTYSFATNTAGSGISINASNGTVSTLPALATGNYTFSVRATDANGVAVTGNVVTINNYTIPTVTTASLPRATQGASYGPYALAWTGGTGTLAGSNPYVLTVGGSTVVNGGAIGNTGLTWSAAGSISGTASASAADQSLSITVKDTQGRTSPAKVLALQFNLVPSAPTYAATTAQIGTPKLVVPTSASAGGAGGTTYEIQSISPANAGITMANATTGQVSINTASSGSFTVAIRAKDSAGTYSSPSNLVVNATAAIVPYLLGSTSITPGQNFGGAVRATGGNGTFNGVAGAWAWSYGGNTLTSANSGTCSYGSLPGIGIQTCYDLSYSATLPLSVKSLIGVVLTGKDSSGATGTATVNILANLLAPTYPATANLTAGTGGTVSRTAPAYGGTGALTYSVSATPSNAGITVDGAGNVIVNASVPSATYSVVVTATDTGSPSVGSISSTAFSVSVASPVTIDTAAVPSGTIGTSYSFQVSASGGSGSITYSATPRPAGLTMSSTGLITGTPTTAGTTSMVVTATDTAGRTTNKTLPFTISAAPLVAPVYPATAAATLGTARTIGATTAASGGTGTKTYAVASSPSNAGITVNSSGVVSIAATVPAGTYSVTVTTTDGATPTPQTAASTAISVNVATAIAITTTTVDSQALNAPYYYQIAASGGSGTLSFLGTNMPPGMYLDGAGVVRGTPTAQGSYTFTVEAYDAFGRTTSKNFSITIGAANAMLLKFGKDYYDGTVPKETLYVCDGYVPNSVCSSGGPSPAMLHYSMTPNSAGQFTVYVHHSTADSRPVNIYVNGTLILYSVAGGTNGTYYAPTAQYNVGRVYLNAGTNTVSIQTTTPGGALPHIEWLQLMP